MFGNGLKRLKRCRSAYTYTHSQSLPCVVRKRRNNHQSHAETVLIRNTGQCAGSQRLNSSGTRESRSMADPPPQVYDVCVVGGGLGGLALAVALEELGLDWQLCEAAEELRTATGTLIGLGGNGLYALEAICPKILDKIKEVSQLSLRSVAHVRPEDPSDPAAEVKEQDLVCPLHTLRWAAMQNVLSDLVNHARVRCGHKCSGWSQQEGDDYITCHFKDKPDVKARMVVGADGVRSAVRNSMIPDDPGPRFLGFMNWNAVRNVPGSSSQPDADTIKLVMDQRGRFKSMVMIIHAGCDQMFWQLRVAAEQPDFTTDKPGGGGIPGSKARVLERLKEHGWEDVIKEVEDTDEAAIYERAAWDRLPLKTWSAAGGRVVLLGDAAHAMYSGPGQGARTAFEDAHQLMLALKAHWPDREAVARQYEDARVLRTTIIQNYAAAMANMKELSAGFKEFWEQQPGGDDTTERFKEFQVWSNSYPEQVHGMPGSRYTEPETLKAFNEHCATVSANAKSSLYMKSKGVYI